MNGDEILLLGIGIQSPWRLISQRLDTEKSPHELHLEVKADRGAKFSCPECGCECSAHDFREKSWRHLNFFQHHCYIHASVPRVKCPEHGVKQIEVPWARKGSAFTLLFEQAAMTLAREMPVNAAARIIDITDKRLWRIVEHYVSKAIGQIDTSKVKAVGLDETASKRGHNYVTVFIDMERKVEPVLFAVPGKGKDTLRQFNQFVQEHGGSPDDIEEAVCDMSPSFLSGIKEHLPNAEITVDWFHIVQTFTRAVDEVRKLEHQQTKLPKHSRWAVLKKSIGDSLTANQLDALAELNLLDLDTSTAWTIKEKLRWIREAKTPQAARWRITNYIRYARGLMGERVHLEPIKKALETLERHAERVVRRWTSTYTNARMEGLNSLFQAARARARGYRNDQTFITMIYMIASPVASILKST